MRSPCCWRGRLGARKPLFCNGNRPIRLMDGIARATHARTPLRGPRKNGLDEALPFWKRKPFICKEFRLESDASPPLARWLGRCATGQRRVTSKITQFTNKLTPFDVTWDPLKGQRPLSFLVTFWH